MLSTHGPGVCPKAPENNSVVNAIESAAPTCGGRSGDACEALRTRLGRYTAPRRDGCLVHMKSLGPQPKPIGRLGRRDSLDALEQFGTGTTTPKQELPTPPPYADECACMLQLMSTRSQAAITVGQRTRDARTKLELSARQAAAHAGMDVTHYSRIERGEGNATLHALVKISAALQTDPGELVAGLTLDDLPASDLRGAHTAHEFQTWLAEKRRQDGT